MPTAAYDLCLFHGQETPQEIGKNWFVDQTNPAGGFVRILDSSQVWEERMDERKMITMEGLTTYLDPGRGWTITSGHCFQILTSSKQVAKTLRLWRGKDAALVGLENHLQLKSPDVKAVTAARAFMATLATSSFRRPSPRVAEPDPRHSEEMLPHPTVADVHDATVSTVPLHRESVAVEGNRLHDSTVVRVRKVTGRMDPPEHLLPISELRKGDVIVSAEQIVRGEFQLGWATVVCLLAFELRDPQILVINGVTMTSPLSSGHDAGEGDETVSGVGRFSQKAARPSIYYTPGL